jgi:hypothetical protein
MVERALPEVPRILDIAQPALVTISTRRVW